MTSAAPLSPGLYLVAVPIGNLKDITLRALETLAACDVIACEDTRRTKQLLTAHAIKAPKTILYNDHADEAARRKIIDAVQSGQSVALVSDAGMPLISDPGYKLVKACAAEDVPITSLPGANAVLTGLQLSALPSDAFTFLGFLPHKVKGRVDALTTFKDTPTTLILYEAPSRLLSTLEVIHEALGNRAISISRELTKMYEETRRGPCSELIEHYKKDGAPKGEIVICIAPPEAAPTHTGDIGKTLSILLKHLSVKEASAVAAEMHGIPKKDAYAMALEIKNG